MRRGFVTSVGMRPRRSVARRLARNVELPGQRRLAEHASQQRGGVFDVRFGQSRRSIAHDLVEMIRARQRRARTADHASRSQARPIFAHLHRPEERERREESGAERRGGRTPLDALRRGRQMRAPAAAERSTASVRGWRDHGRHDRRHGTVGGAGAAGLDREADDNERARRRRPAASDHACRANESYVIGRRAAAAAAAAEAARTSRRTGAGCPRLRRRSVR